MRTDTPEPSIHLPLEAIYSAGDSSEIHKKLLSEINKHFQADLPSLFIISPITKHPIREIYFKDGNEFINKEISGDNALIVLQDRTTVLVVSDINQESNHRYQNAFVTEHRIQSFVAVPIYAASHTYPLAVLFLNYDSPREFSEDFKHRLQQIAQQAGFILELDWFRYRYQKVNDYGKAINAVISSKEKVISDLGIHLADVIDLNDFYMLASHQPEQAELRLIVHEGGTSYDKIIKVSGLTEWVIENQQPQHIRNFSEEKDSLPVTLVALSIDKREPVWYESLIFVPLTWRGVSLGVLSIQNRRANAFDADDVHLLELIGNHVASVLHSNRLYRDLQRLDELGKDLMGQPADDSAEVILQKVAHWIRDRSRSDLVMLYDYDKAENIFRSYRSGTFKNRDFQYAPKQTTESHYMIQLAVQRNEDVWACNSHDLYRLLGGDPAKRGGNFETREQVTSSAMLPLHFGNEPVGILFINFRGSKPQLFDDSQRMLITSLANYAAVAIHLAKERKLDEIKRRDQLEQLQIISNRINQTLELEDTLNAILNAAKQHVGFDSGAVYLADADDNLIAQAAHGDESELVRNKPITPDMTSLARWVFDHNEPRKLDDVSVDGPYLDLIKTTKSEIGVPIVDGDKAIGVILCSDMSQTAAYDDRKMLFLSNLAELAAIAIQNARTYEREAKNKEVFKKLGELALGINIQLSKDEKLFTAILDAALQITEADAGQLMLLQGEDHLDIVATAPPNAETHMELKRLPLSQGVVGRTARNHAKGRKNTRIANIPDTSDPDQASDYVAVFKDMRSELVILLLEGSEETLRGVINLESRKPHQFDQIVESELPTLFGDLMMIALQNAERYEEQQRRRLNLRKLAKIDDHILSEKDPEKVREEILKSVFELIDEAKLCTLHRFTNGVLNQILAYGDKQGFYPCELQSMPRIEQVAHMPGDAEAPYLILNRIHPAQPENEVNTLLSNAQSALAYRLVTDQDTVWVLNVEAEVPGAFSSEEAIRELIGTFAGQAKIAIENARMFRQIAKRNAQLETIAQIASRATLTEGRNQQRLMQEFVDEACERPEIDIDYMGVFLIEREGPSQQRILLQAGYGPAAEEMLKDNYSLPYNDQSMIGRCIIEQKPEVASNTDKYERPIRKNPYAPNTRSEIALPLFRNVSEFPVGDAKGQKEVFGAITVQSNTVNHFHDDDTQVFTVLADLLAASLEIARSLELRAQAERRLDALNEIGKRLTELHSEEQLDPIFEHIIQLVAKPQGRLLSFRRFDAYTQEMRLVDSQVSYAGDFGFTRIIPKGQKVNGVLVERYLDDQSFDHLCVNDLGNPPMPIPALGEGITGIQSILGALITFEGTIYGSITLGHAARYHFTDYDIALMRGIANLLGITYHRIHTAHRVVETQHLLREARVMADLGRLNYRLPHRLINDLGRSETYIGWIQKALSHETLSEGGRNNIADWLKEIRSDVERVLDLATKLREQAKNRMKAGDSPDEILSEAFLRRVVAYIASNANITFEYAIDSDVGTLYVIESEIGAIITQLIFNAQSLMPNGGRIIFNVRNFVDAQGQRYVDIEVEDSGPGIPTEIWARVFEVGYSTRGGSGFGLYDALETAKHNFGDLFISWSEIDRGTRFTLRLPSSERARLLFEARRAAEQPSDRVE